MEQRVAEVRNRLQYGPAATARTFSEAAVQYVTALERRGKDPGRALQDIRLVVPWIGDLPLDHVHHTTLEAFVEAQRGVRRSGTVARALRTVIAVLNYAARVLRDGNQPWLATAVPRIEQPDWGDSTQPVRLTWEEQDHLVAALPSHLVAPVLFAVWTGARQNEIVTLRWSQQAPVQGLPEFSVWWIPPEIRKSNARKTLGQQQGRNLICNATARSVVAGQSQESEFVFPSPSGGPLYRINNHGWRTAVAKAGLAVRVHDLRHTFGERLATIGVPFDARQTLLGHENHNVTLHYSTPGLSRLLEEAEKVKRETVAMLRPIRPNPAHLGR